MQVQHRSQTELKPTTLLAKPDWPQARKRWIAYWEMQNTDRPLLDIGAPLPGRAARFAALPPPKDDEARYCDPDFVSRYWLCCFETAYYGGESFPSVGHLRASYALGCGSHVTFDSNSVWHQVTMKSMAEPLGWHPGPDDPRRHTLDKVMQRLLDLSPGKFFNSYQSQVMVNDLLTLIRGVDDFMADIATDTDLCVRRLEEMFEMWSEEFDHYRELVDARQKDHGYVWGNLWNPRFFMVTQSDMSCMISAEMYGKYVVKELEGVARRYSDTIWYHLDGPGALHHLPLLLSKPYIRVVQWVPGAGQPDQGPAWLDIYRRVQQSGRGLDLYLRSGTTENMKIMEYLIRHLRPEGLIIRCSVDTREQADELIANATRWCGSHIGKT